MNESKLYSLFSYTQYVIQKLVHITDMNIIFPLLVHVQIWTHARTYTQPNAHTQYFSSLPIPLFRARARSLMYRHTTATHCNTLQHTAMQHTAMQHTATCCSTFLSYTSTRLNHLTQQPLLHKPSLSFSLPFSLQEPLLRTSSFSFSLSLSPRCMPSLSPRCMPSHTPSFVRARARALSHTQTHN